MVADCARITGGNWGGAAGDVQGRCPRKDVLGEMSQGDVLGGMS